MQTVSDQQISFCSPPPPPPPPLPIISDRSLTQITHPAGPSPFRHVGSYHVDRLNQLPVFNVAAQGDSGLWVGSGQGRDGRITPPYQRVLSEQFHHFVQSCLEMDPKERSHLLSCFEADKPIILHQRFLSFALGTFQIFFHQHKYYISKRKKDPKCASFC